MAKYITLSQEHRIPIDTLWGLWLPSHVILITFCMDPTQLTVSLMELGLNKLQHVGQVVKKIIILFVLITYTISEL